MLLKIILVSVRLVFDGEGIGIHYRAHEIAPEASQLDIYLNRKQTQQILKPEIYQQMF